MQQLEDEPDMDVGDPAFIQLKVIMLERIATLERDHAALLDLPDDELAPYLSAHRNTDQSSVIPIGIPLYSATSADGFKL